MIDGRGEVEALLYEAGGNGSCDCHVCSRRCHIAPGKDGFCHTRVNRDGRLFSIIYGMVSSIAVDPIEKKPLYHFHPGTRVLSVGSIGCNLRCGHCQNWTIAYEDAVKTKEELRFISPEELIQAALDSGSAGVAWTYNEPAIWLEYALDCARLCRAAGLYTAYVTNGFATAEGIDAIGPWLDAYRVDIKGFGPESYKTITGLSDFSPVLAGAVRAKTKWGCHVECVTNIVPTVNDDETELRRLAEWIVSELGPDTPWHVTRSFPYGRMSDLPATPLPTMLTAQRIGREAGLGFVYTGNLQEMPSSPTICPDCGHELVLRRGFAAAIGDIDEDGRCRGCGRNSGITV